MYMNYFLWIHLFSVVLCPADNAHHGFPRLLALSACLLLLLWPGRGSPPCSPSLICHFLIPNAFSVIVSDILFDFCFCFLATVLLLHLDQKWQVSHCLVVFKMCTSPLYYHTYFYIYGIDHSVRKKFIFLILLQEIHHFL